MWFVVLLDCVINLNCVLGFKCIYRMSFGVGLVKFKVVDVGV